MELRHFRYFVAVVEEGSFNRAATLRLHTAQPSLSRQIGDLEDELGVQLLTRSSQGLEPTAAGRAFLDHARLILAQADAASEAAKRAGKENQASLAVGFLTGFEIDWLPKVLKILRGKLNETDLIVSSRSTPSLIKSLIDGEVDLAFLRPDPQVTELSFKTVVTEPIMAILPVGHELASHQFIDPADLVGQPFIRLSKVHAPAVRSLVDGYLDRVGVRTGPGPEGDNMSMVISLTLSAHAIALLPAYAKALLPPSLVCIPLSGEPPMIQLAVATNKSRQHRLAELVISKLDGRSAHWLPVERALKHQTGSTANRLTIVGADRNLSRCVY
ncbi:LysR family transcriptional regulator, hca operon transcriptional activator [Burkholderia sp. D7]|nr:LysR family transcriptional regulator, hca operon transcriptional activator [Burkholderia sp. D7]